MRMSRLHFGESVGTFSFVLEGCGGDVLAGGSFLALLRLRLSVKNPERPARSPWRWVAPSLLTLVFVGVVSFAARPLPSPSPRGAAAEASRLRRDLDQALGSICRILNGITNEASAKAALPGLRELRATVDGLRREADRLPMKERAQMEDLSTPRLGELRSAYRRATSNAGAAGPVQGVLADLMARLGAPVGSAPSERPSEAR